MAGELLGKLEFDIYFYYFGPHSHSLLFSSLDFRPLSSWSRHSDWMEHDSMRTFTHSSYNI